MPEDDDPLSGVANFFDLGLVFALGFMLALIGYAGLERRESPAESADHPSDGPPKTDTRPLTRYRASSAKGKGAGERLGTAWRLDSGEVVYVPEGKSVTGDGQVIDARPTTK